MRRTTGHSGGAEGVVEVELGPAVRDGMDRCEFERTDVGEAVAGQQVVVDVAGQQVVVESGPTSREWASPSAPTTVASG